MSYVIILLIVALLILILSPKKKPQKTQNEAEHKEPAAPRLYNIFNMPPEYKEAARQAQSVWDDETYNKIMQGYYDGPLPEHTVGDLWTDIYPDKYRTSIAGINYRKAAASRYESSYFDCLLVPDPKNKHDKNAIKVLHKETGVHLGFIPANETDEIRAIAKNAFPFPCRAHIKECEDTNDYDEHHDSYRTFFVGEIVINK